MRLGPGLMRGGELTGPWCRRCTGAGDRVSAPLLSPHPNAGGGDRPMLDAARAGPQSAPRHTRTAPSTPWRIWPPTEIQLCLKPHRAGA